MRKYLRYVDSLKVVYAYHDDSCVEDIKEIKEVEFVHVSEFYDEMQPNVVKEFKELIEHVGILKRGR